MTTSISASVLSSPRSFITGNMASLAGLVAIRSLGNTSASSGGRSLDILAILNSSPELRDFFDRQLASISKDPQFASISKPNAGHLALVETVMANRSEFPAGEFMIHTELPDGGSITTTIPAMGSAAYSAYFEVTPEESKNEAAIHGISRSASDVSNRYRSY